MPTANPMLRISALTLPPIPSFSRGTIDITKELFGDWNSPFPSDIRPIKTPMTLYTGCSSNVAISRRPALVSARPISVRSSEPNRSERYPLTGAARDRTSG